MGQSPRGIGDCDHRSICQTRAWLTIDSGPRLEVPKRERSRIKTTKRMCGITSIVSPPAIAKRRDSLPKSSSSGHFQNSHQLRSARRQAFNPATSPNRLSNRSSIHAKPTLARSKPRPDAHQDAACTDHSLPKARPLQRRGEQAPEFTPAHQFSKEDRPSV